MRQDDPVHPSLQRAYRVFIEEMSGHIEEALRFCTGKAESESFDLNALRVGFHKIKGGAGFFGLSEIAQISREIEHLLGQADRAVERQGELLGLISTLQKQALELKASLESEQKKD